MTVLEKKKKKTRKEKISLSFFIRKGHGSTSLTIAEKSHRRKSEGTEELPAESRQEALKAGLSDMANWVSAHQLRA
jgi:hypothetical protein